MRGKLLIAAAALVSGCTTGGDRYLLVADVRPPRPVIGKFPTLAECESASERLSIATHCTLEAREEWAYTRDTPGTPSPARAAINPAPIIPMPPIPTALRGCWRKDDPDTPDSHQVLLITATRLTLDGREVVPEYIQAVTATSVHGLFSTVEGTNRATVATSLRLAEPGDPPAQLVVQEGDAGSYFYSRC